MSNKELEKELKKQMANVKKNKDGFTLLHYSIEALEKLEDIDMARIFVEAAEKTIGQEDQPHPCDIGKQIYEVFKDSKRAKKAYESALKASGWDASSIKSTEKDWAKISKSFS